MTGVLTLSLHSLFGVLGQWHEPRRLTTPDDNRVTVGQPLWPLM